VLIAFALVVVYDNKDLREITGRVRNRVYRADEILCVIDAPLE